MQNPIKKLTNANRLDPKTRTRILDKISSIINELYQEPKYKKYSDMKLAKVTNNGSTIEYAKHQGWDDGADTPDPERNKLFQEFQKDLLARIEERLSDDLKQYGIKIVEDDDFYLVLQEETEFSVSDDFLLAIHENAYLSDQ